MCVFTSDSGYDDTYLMNHSASGTETAGRSSSASSDLHAFTSAQLRPISRKGKRHDIWIGFLKGRVAKWLN